MFLLGHRLGNYEILKNLGHGTFGVVYLVRDVLLDLRRAIKVPFDQSPAGRDSLLAESRLLATLEHPNIVRLLACDEQDEVLFVVMEWVDGAPLSRRIEAEAPFPASLAMRIARQVLAALKHAHRLRLLHGDLSSDNILLSGNTAKVSDFGIARTVHVAEHGTRRVGNPLYMAPEQLRGEAVFASDLYSLGVVLYQMLTGRLPYQDADPERQLALIEAGGSTHPRRENPLLSRELDAVAAKALAPLVSDRYPSAEACLSDLRELASFGPGTEELEAVRRRVRNSRPRRGRFCWSCGRARHPDAPICAHCGA